MKENFSEKICGVFADSNGNVNLSIACSDGSRISKQCTFKPFAWASRECDAESFEDLHEPTTSFPHTPLNRLVFFDNPVQADTFFKNRNKALPYMRLPSVENQFMTSENLRMFSGMRFDEIRRIQLDIEVNSQDNSFPNAKRENDRIIAVGLSGFGGTEILEIQAMDDDSERALLEKLCKRILEIDPDFIEGHNIFKFDIPYIAERSKRLKVPMNWGRFGQGIQMRKSRLNIAERTINYTRCDIAGRTVVDTLLLVQFYDVSAREMASYSLKESAIHFEISTRQQRTYIDGSEIKNIFHTNRETFRKYLLDDLRETAGISEKLLPTYVAQAQNFPMTMQECLLRGNGMKVESVFLQKYFQQRAALPMAQSGAMFEGGLSEGFETGLFKNVLHYDVASLYPSLMLVIGECPKNDYLNTFLDELKRLREYRLKYKKLAREADNAQDKLLFDSRQKSFKILINSFYGYLGLSTAIFSDVELASKITATGRELLQKLIDAFKAEGCSVLEADTDGIYLVSEEYFSKPEALLEKVKKVLPDGVDLDFDGSYSAMLCYKAKNYALLENGKTILRGSAFRNRSTEPFLQKLTQTLIHDILLEREDEIPSLISKSRETIASGKADIADLAKSEFISKAPFAYQKDVSATGKGRRASMEAALLMNPQPTAGDKVSYFICKLDGKKNPDWKCARPLEMYNPETLPYSADYYLKKIDDWQKRFEELIKGKAQTQNAVQGELF